MLSLLVQLVLSGQVSQLDQLHLMQGLVDLLVQSLRLAPLGQWLHRHHQFRHKLLSEKKIQLNHMAEVR
jgi:hypothetical protein